MIKAAVETSSLWRDFTWPCAVDHHEEHLIKCALSTCGSHIKRLSFSGGLGGIAVTTLQHCRNLVRLSLPSAKLDHNQLYDSRALPCIPMYNHV